MKPLISITVAFLLCIALAECENTHENAPDHQRVLRLHPGGVERDSVLLVGDSLCIDGRHIPLDDWHRRWIRTEPQPIIDKPDS